MNTGMFEEDEPALRDSLLLLDTDLEDPDHDTSMEVVVPENNSDHEMNLPCVTPCYCWTLT